MTVTKTDPKILPKLEDVIAFEFDDIIYRFMEDWDLPFEEVKEIFVETKKWLWLHCAHYHDRQAKLNPPPLGFTGSTFMLDQMWHQFMLYTPNYHRFTHDFFGYFLGHAPIDHATKLEMEAAKKADPEGESRNMEEGLKAQIAYIVEKLGPATATKWYTTWKDQYSEEKLNALRKPIVLQGF